MKIKRKTKIGNHKVYDITVEKNNSYVLENGAVSHNTGLYYNCNNIIFIGRRQNKKDGKVLGYEFIMNIEKSRFVKEGVKLPFKVTYEEGIYTYSGLLSFALEGGYVTKPKLGWYTRTCVEGDKNFREKELEMSDDFWKPIFENTDFEEYVRKTVQLGTVIVKEKEKSDE